MCVPSFYRWHERSFGSGPFRFSYKDFGIVGIDEGKIDEFAQSDKALRHALMSNFYQGEGLGDD